MNKTILISIGLICAMIAAVGIMYFNDIYRKAEEPNICELVLRTQFEHNTSLPNKKDGAYCIDIDNKDPSDNFMARFKGHQPPVKKGSEFILEQDVKFSIDNFKWLNNWTVEVDVDYFRQPKCGFGYTYRIIWKVDCWTIEKILLLWIS